MSNLVLSLVSTVTKRVKANFVRNTQNVTAAQEKFLLSLLRLHQNTEFGKQYGLAEVKTVAQFRDRIPVLSYSHYEPYVERIAQGEPNILTPDPIIYLNLSSGSTGKQKLIPVTHRSRRVRSQVNQTSTGFLIEALQRRKLPIGKILVTTSARAVGQTSSGIDYGFVSAGDLRLNSGLYRQIAAQPFEALQSADSLARHYVCLLFALSDPQTRIIGANFPVLGLQLSHYLESYAEDFIQDIETGEIAHWLKLEPEIRAKLERCWSSHPKRAAELRHLLKTEGRLTPHSVWNLSAVVTALGGTSSFYLERFPSYFGDTPIFGGIYASSEAAFGTYYELNNEGAVLAVNAGFFEFIAEDQWQAAQPKTLLPCEVTPGNYYRIVVTNYSGLYRYDINDVVEVLGFYNEAPIIVFRHRLGGLLSSTTEKTTEFHVAQVMQRLQQNFNLALENFCVTLSEHEIPPHYLVNIELASGERLTHSQDFIQQFDRYLQEVQPSYAVKRPGTIPPPRLRILASGSFATLQQRLLKRGIPESQLKFPHISDDRHLLTGLTIAQEIAMEE
ncbi:GH3 auxin-responsive promoter family protein [Leptolyngbya sp. FACHB-711]|uniref:GH3 auxin-responsive promoter family protein n=1 Tax=unclassified Leptolyngbya TaxID=2650499 RepID=UPI001683403E|nr:GH3 auxin-responsive promoter family protein [Leptolyngbya sp. FACHB-711]MBD1853623.1 GH3 auxin-responsive promoter family protein [Cyanobacteria bacterium FACHB-502]MBD2024954.1 GH3 auxin-responsive promoter family protein [Leptolyngbya sp. FACHB-711]